eukprot:gene4939-6912_t
MGCTLSAQQQINELNKVNEVDLSQHEYHPELPKSDKSNSANLFSNVNYSKNPINSRNNTEDYLDLTQHSITNDRIQNQSPLINEPYSINDFETSQTTILGCFDGHGQFGHLVSQFCKLYLEKFLPVHPLFLSDINNAIIETISQIDNILTNNDNKHSLNCNNNHSHNNNDFDYKLNEIDCNFSGTTLVLCCFRGLNAIVSYLGDSRIIIGNKSKRSDDRNGLFDHRQLSKDHRPDLPLERSRIEASKGRVVVSPNGPPRIYLPDCDMPGLAMSRSIGDTRVHEIGVSSVPEFLTLDMMEYFRENITNRSGVINPNDNNNSDVLMVIATDGLFDMMSNEQVVSFCYERMHGGTKGTGVGNGIASYGLDVIIDDLLTDVIEKWIKNHNLADDISLFLVVISMFPQEGNCGV